MPPLPMCGLPGSSTWAYHPAPCPPCFSKPTLQAQQPVKEKVQAMMRLTRPPLPTIRTGESSSISPDFLEVSHLGALSIPSSQASWPRPCPFQGSMLQGHSQEQVSVLLPGSPAPGQMGPQHASWGLVGWGRWGWRSRGCGGVALVRPQSCGHTLPLVLGSFSLDACPPKGAS